MKYWMNAIGYGIPSSIQLTKIHIYKGNPMYAQWYGRYSLNKSSISKMLLILWNGERRKH